MLKDIYRDERKSRLRLKALFGFLSRVQEVRVLGDFSFQLDWLSPLSSEFLIFLPSSPIS